jgi:hypothetical protein
MLRICIGFLRIFNLFMCFNVFIIIFYILRFSKKTPYIFYFLKTMIINTNLYCSIFTSFFHFCFYCYIYIFFHCAILCEFNFIGIFLICPYFRGNSLNSRAGLELKEIRLFPRLLQKQKIKFIFFRKIIVEKQWFFLVEFQPFFWTIIVEKGRTSLNSRPSLEFKELPWK